MTNPNSQKNGCTARPIPVAWRNCVWDVRVQVQPACQGRKRNLLPSALPRRPATGLRSGLQFRNRPTAPTILTRSAASQRSRRLPLVRSHRRDGLSGRLVEPVTLFARRPRFRWADRSKGFAGGLLDLATLPLGISSGLNLTIRHLFQKSQPSPL